MEIMSTFERHISSFPPYLPPSALLGWLYKCDSHEADKLVVPHHVLGKVAVEEFFLLFVRVQTCEKGKISAEASR